MNTPPKALSDFPDWFGPMLVKELRQGLKARAFVLSFIGLQIVLVLVTIYHALLYAKHPAGFNGSGLSAIFWMLIAVQLLLITPVRALGALANERKANTLELIYMTGLTSWRIAWGKWASLMFQAVLFLLAVLPYAILRYFFGGMNLAEEMLMLALALLCCAIFSAVTLGISGMPVAIRVISFCIAGFFGTSIMPMLLFGMVMRGSGGMGSASFSLLTLGYGWILVLYNAALLIVGAIEVAAATISPPAGNSTLRLRMLALLVWLPVPLLFALKVGSDAIWGQIGLACGVSTLLCWQNLSAPAEVMRSHLEPYARAGRAAPFVGSFFLPGWPSAVLFLILMEAIALLSTRSEVLFPRSASVQWPALAAALLMGGAALMTPPLLWQLVRRKPQWPLFAHTLVLILSGVLFSFHDALDLTPGSRLGEYVWLACFPPVGFWAMLDGGLDGEASASAWLAVSLLAFLVCAAGLLLFSKGYWIRVWQLSKAVRQPAKAPVTPLPVAA